jgi:hypothetical protein
MKKTKLILVALVAVILMSFVAEKFIVVKMSEEKMNFHWNSLNTIKQIANGSSMPHNQVIYILQSIDSLQKDIQASASLDSTSSQTLKK